VTAALKVCAFVLFCKIICFYWISELKMGVGSSRSNDNKGEDCLSSSLLSRNLSLGTTDKPKRRRNQKQDIQTTHVEYDSLKGYGYHFESKAFYFCIKNEYNHYSVSV
jgi:hypothetical protein